MRRIGSKGMKPELQVRRLVHAEGYRYRLHRYDLPGRPDLVFVGLGKVIFVNGCFWHYHENARCKIARVPKSNRKYWGPKLEATRDRDRKNVRKLRRLGWGVLVVWECELRNEEAVRRRIRRFLGGGDTNHDSCLSERRGGRA